MSSGAVIAPADGGERLPRLVQAGDPRGRQVHVRIVAWRYHRDDVLFDQRVNVDRLDLLLGGDNSSAATTCSIVSRG